MCYDCTYVSCEMLGKITEVHTNSYLVNPAFRMWCCATGWVFPHILKDHVTEDKDPMILRHSKIFSANDAAWHPRRLGYPATLLWKPQISSSLPLQKHKETTNKRNNTLCSAAGSQPTKHTFSGQDTSQFNTLKGVKTI